MLSLKYVIEFGIITLSNAEPANTAVPSSVTVLGMSILLKLVP